MLRPTIGSPGSRFRAMPSMPAVMNAAIARYGFTAPDTARHSNRPGSGVRNMCVRLLSPYVMNAGTQVNPDRAPVR